MDADVLDRVQTDQAASVVRRAAADAGDEAVLVRQPSDLGPGLLGHGRILGPLHDRRQRPVDVEQDGGLLRLAAEPNEQNRRVRHTPRI